MSLGARIDLGTVNGDFVGLFCPFAHASACRLELVVELGEQE